MAGPEPWDYADTAITACGAVGRPAAARQYRAGHHHRAIYRAGGRAHRQSGQPHRSGRSWSCCVRSSGRGTPLFVLSSHDPQMQCYTDRTVYFSDGKIETESPHRRGAHTVKRETAKRVLALLICVLMTASLLAHRRYGGRSHEDVIDDSTIGAYTSYENGEDAGVGRGLGYNRKAQHGYQRSYPATPTP